MSQELSSKAYAFEIKGFDFGLMTARNQLISKVINPALDSLMTEIKWDHIQGSETSYSLTLYIKAEWETPTPEIQ